MAEFPMSDRGRADDQRTIRDGVGNGAILLRLGQQVCSSHRRTCLTKGRFPRAHDAQVADTEIAHGARRGAQIQRIPRSYHYYTKAIEVCLHGWAILRLAN